MADPTLTKTLNTLTVITNDVMLPMMIDNIIDSNYLTKKLLGRSKSVDGGDKIKQLLEYGDERPQWMAEWDKVQYKVKEFATAAYYEWAHVVDTLVFSEKQLRVQNTGKEQILELAEVGMRNVTKTFKRGFGDMLFANRAKTEKEPYNLYDIIVNYNSSLAGIDPSDSTYDWWQARKIALSTGLTYANLVDPDNDYYLEKIMGSMYDELSNDEEYPDLIVTTKKTWRTYENLLRTQNRYEGKMRVNGSFRILEFDNAEVVWDTRVPEGQIYFLNTNYLGFKHHKDFNFKMGEFKEITTGEEGYAAKLSWYGAFVCSHRGYQGVVTGVPENPITIS